MRIMHLELGRHLYGGAKQVEYLIKAIAVQSNAVEQHLVCAEGSDIAALRLSDCETHALPYAGEPDISILWRLAGLVRALQPDILHVHSRRGADLWGAIIARYTGIPAICTRRVDNPESAISRLKYARYKAVISISEGVQKVVAQRCPASVFQQVIHSSVDLSEFHYAADPDWFRRTLAIPEGYRVLANFAQLIERKGQQDIIAAMKQVVAKQPNTLCLLFGKGSLADDYQLHIDQAGISDNVRLCGFTEQVSRILPNIDLLVHPAHAEGLGVILLQAGACKVPVIASPSGGIPEIIKHEKTGWLTPAGDSDKLATAICSALDNDDLRHALSEALLNHVSTHFSTEAMAKGYLSLYQHIKG